MNNPRRQFIKNAGIASMSIGLLPGFASIENLFDVSRPLVLARKSPESQGVSSKAISDFLAAANGCKYEWHSFMLLRHGNVIAEGWWKPFAAQYKHTLYSLSKSFTSTAIGLLVAEGKLKVTDEVVSFFPKEVPATISDNLKKMQVKHLLTMNTGHGEDTMSKMRAAGNQWMQTFLAQPVTFEPGSHFLYNTGATYMLGAIVYKLTGKKLEEYLSSRLFQPLGIANYDWETSPEGLNTAGYGLRIKTEDIARFGQMYLQKGKWDNKQILPEAWVNEATGYQTKSNEGNGDWSQGYGYQFWRCKPGFYRGDGAYGQYCIVMPQYDAVLAITGESWDMQKSMNIAWDTLLPGMQSSTLPGNEADYGKLKKDIAALTVPVPKGDLTSSMSAAYHGKTYKVAANTFDVRATSFDFSKDACTWKIKTIQGEQTFLFGWGNWAPSQNSNKYLFFLPGRLHVPSKLAGAAVWTDSNTLQLTNKFAEAMHSDIITCHFEDDKVTISFLNSVSANNKNDVEKRQALTGKREA
jgi:hypothetical protein